MYEPEQFLGLIYRKEKLNTVLFLFQSGNLVCTGPKNETAIYKAVQETRSELAN